MKTIYQTLQNRDNPEEVEEHGPYKCIRSDAWLGCGYYFWYYQQFAHWWGKVAKWDLNKGSGYFICSILCDLSPNHTLDLAFDPDMIEDFATIVENYIEEFINNQRTVKPSDLTSRAIFEDISNWYDTEIKAVMLKTDGAVGEEYSNILPRIKFGNYKAHYSVYPEVQICVINPDIFRKTSFQIIYPEEYVSQGCI